MLKKDLRKDCSSTDEEEETEKLHTEPTGTCLTPTMQSEPSYTYVKQLSTGTESHNIDFVTNATGIYKGSLLSPTESVSESKECDELEQRRNTFKNKPKTDGSTPKLYDPRSGQIAADCSLSEDDCEFDGQVSWVVPVSPKGSSKYKQNLIDSNLFSQLDSKEMEGGTSESMNETPKRISVRTACDAKKPKRKTKWAEHISQNPLSPNLARLKHIGRDSSSLKDTEEESMIWSIPSYSGNQLSTMVKAHSPKVRCTKKSSLPEVSDNVGKQSDITEPHSKDCSISWFIPISPKEKRRNASIKEIWNSRGQKPIDADNIIALMINESKREFQQKKKSKEKFCFKDYVDKLAETATRYNLKEKGRDSKDKTYFDFGDYCRKLFELKVRLSQQSEKK